MLDASAPTVYIQRNATKIAFKGEEKHTFRHNFFLAKEHQIGKKNQQKSKHIQLKQKKSQQNDRGQGATKLQKEQRTK